MTRTANARKARKVRMPRLQNTNKTVREEPVGLDVIIVALALMTSLLLAGVFG